jgi:hypothetical protein
MMGKWNRVCKRGFRGGFFHAALRASWLVPVPRHSHGLSTHSYLISVRLLFWFVITKKEETIRSTHEYEQQTLREYTSTSSQPANCSYATIHPQPLFFESPTHVSTLLSIGEMRGM